MIIFFAMDEEDREEQQGYHCFVHKVKINQKAVIILLIDMKKLLILCGGQSPEHKIAIRSCKSILRHIDQSKYDITLIGINRRGGWRLLEGNEIGEEITSQGRPVSIIPGAEHCFWSEDMSLGVFDVVFPVLHGVYGEDGTIQGMLRLLGIPFVGAGVLGSSVAMDKEVAKRLLRENHLPVCPYLLIRKGESIPAYSTVAAALGKVMFVKPANMGSSVGVHIVEREEQWKEALDDALKYDGKVLIEKAIEGRELECAVLGNETVRTSGIGEVRSGTFYSYDQKYRPDSKAEVIIPANLNSEIILQLKALAIKAYKTLDGRGMSRVDMFLSEEEGIYINEINTIPGFTDISMYPKLWEAEGLGYSELIDTLITLSMER